MIPLAVIDLIADDWVQTRRVSAQRYGTRPSRIFGWLSTLGRTRETPAAAAPISVVTPERSNRAA